MIEVKQSCILIHNYQLGDCPKLESYLTVYEKMKSGYMLPSMSAYLYDEDNECLIIPRGYNIPRLQAILNDFEIKYNDTHDESRRIAIQCTSEPLNDLQREAISFLIGDTEVFGKFLYDSQKFLALKTGKGKTYVTINAICQLKRRAIVIVDSLNIAEQWKDALLQHTNIKEREIYLFSGKSSVTKILNEKKFEPDYKVYIALHQTLASLTKKNLYAINTLFKKIKIGIKVYDEAHTSWNNMFIIDGTTNVENTFYLTATPGRSNPQENRLYNYVFEKVPIYGRNTISTGSYKYESEEVAEEDAYIKVYLCNYNSNPPYNDQVKMNKNGRFDMNYFSDYTKSYAYVKFYEVICSIIDICLKHNNDRRIAITLVKNDMIQKLYDDLSITYPDISIGRFCGLVSNKEKEQEKEKKIILSTEKSLGKAINIENIGYLINTVPFSSSVISEQMIGRLRRNDKYSFLFDVCDIGITNCKSSQKYRKESYTKIALSMREVNY